MSRVKVWNDNVHDFTQKFREETVFIKSKGFIEMDYEDAVTFLGKPFPMKFDGNRIQKPESYKMLRIETRDGKIPLEGETKVVAFKCHKDGTLHATQADLDKHINENFLDSLEDTELAEQRKKTKRA